VEISIGKRTAKEKKEGREDGFRGSLPRVGRKEKNVHERPLPNL